jgi:hypothetical protein
MRKIPLVLAAAASLALATAAHAQQSWGPKHTTYWSSEATGKFAPGQFMTSTIPLMQPPADVRMQAPVRQQRMYYQPANKRMRAPMRVRQQQPGQPPAEAKPSAPPTDGQPRMQNQQPGQVPK